MANRVDLNCDMGESFGRYKLGLDEEAMASITSANIACGCHAGDPHVMHATVKMARDRGVAVGAHPGYPDLLGFGRRSMQVDPEELKDYIIYQAGALQGFCSLYGMKLQHIKPHGALYNDAGANPVLARAVAEAVRDLDSSLVLLALAGSELEKAGRDCGLKTACEVFADRNYNPDGSLVSRSLPDAIIRDEEVAAQRVVQMVSEGRVLAVDGSWLPVRVDSICVHGDTPGAVAFIRNIRQAFQSQGVTVAPMREVLG